MSPSLVTLGGMTKHITRKIATLTVLYILLIVGIFALQFTRGNAFSQAFGSMIVSGALETDDQGVLRPLLPLHIVANGIDVYVDEHSPVRAFTGTNTSVPLTVTGYSRQSSSFTLECSERVQLVFTSEKLGGMDMFSITARMPEKYQKIALPYKITRSARLERRDSLTLVQSGKQLFTFSAPVDLTARTLQIYRSDPVLSYKTWTAPRGLVITDLSTLPGAAASEWRRVTESFASSALAVFKSAIDSGSFTEQLATVYIAEMGRIGMYRTAVEAIPENFRNSPSRTWISSPFLNNLVRTWASQIQKERENRILISRYIAEGNTAVFEFPNLVQYLIDRESPVVLSDVERLASSATIADLSALRAAGILEAALDFGALQPGRENTFALLAASCEQRLQASMVRIKDKLYLSDDGKTISTVDTLRVAAILIRHGTVNPEWRSVGTLLGTSILAFAPESASLPSQFAFTGDAENRTGVIAKAERVLDAVTLYPLVMPNNSWNPRAVSLAASAGAGVWAWTSALDVRVSRPSAEQYKIIVRFPQGESHYMVLRGIKPFYRIQLYGMDFRTDQRFESYNSSGYVYNEQTETLYLKMRHKTEEEEVILYLGKPSASAGQSESGFPGEAGSSAGGADSLSGETSPAGTETSSAAN